MARFLCCVSGRLRRWRITIAAVLKPLQLGFNLPVALGNLILIEPVQLEGLGQLEDVLFPPVALQRLGNGCLVGFDPGSRNCASCRGSRWPSTMASMMSMPVLPVISLMTWWSFTFIWVSAFCICWIWWEAYCTR